MSSFTIVAKAGGSHEGAENTSSAIQAALAAKPPTWARLAIEVDLRMTADGSLVVIHDASVDRTTDGRGLVRALDLAHVRALSCGPGREQIPVLEEIFDLTDGHELVLDVHDDGARTAAAVVHALHRAIAR